MNWPWEAYVCMGLALWGIVRLGRIAEQLHRVGSAVIEAAKVNAHWFKQLNERLKK